MVQTILFIFLAIFPLGQIVRIGIVQPIDIVVGIAALWAILKKYPRPKIYKSINSLLVVFLFSTIVSFFIFKSNLVFYGVLYLARFSAYLYFIPLVIHFVKAKKSNSGLLEKSLILISFFVAIFGWFQYFTLPNIKPFIVFGWDDHLFRLVSTFLDPGYTGFIILSGLLVILGKKDKNKFFLIFFFLLSIAFTYSRAVYVALAAALLYRRKLFLILFFALLVFLLPKNLGGQGVNLARTFSISARVTNYEETSKIFYSNPLIGVGYNNMCLARNIYLGKESFKSHSCSGSDSSILFILATTGAIGLISFGLFAYSVWKSSNSLTKTFLLSLFVFSLFANGFFYSWIMGIFTLLVGISLGGKRNS